MLVGRAPGEEPQRGFYPLLGRRVIDPSPFCGDAEGGEREPSHAQACGGLLGRWVGFVDPISIEGESGVGVRAFLKKPKIAARKVIEETVVRALEGRDRAKQPAGGQATQSGRSHRHELASVDTSLSAGRSS